MAYRCESCGAYHETDSPPCLECAGESIVPEAEYTDAEDSDQAAQAAPKWRCEGCGKVYSHNSPPCSRCGSMQLTADPDAEIDQGDPTADVVERRGALWYASRAAAVVAVIVVLAAGMSVVSGDPVATQLFSSEPEPIDVAGADEQYQGSNLSAIERSVAEGINNRRSGDRLVWSAELHAAAEYHNHRAVRDNYRGWARDQDKILEDIRSFGASCQSFGGATNNYPAVGDQAYVETGTSSEVAAGIVTNLWQYEETRSRLVGGHSRIAVDLFVTEDQETLLVVYVC